MLFKTLESFNSYENLEEKPVGEIVFCCGFFLVYLVEEMVHTFVDSHMNHHGSQQSKKVHRYAANQVNMSLF